MNQKDYDKALADLSESIRLDPGFVVAYDARSLVHRRKGDLDKAIADLDEVIRLDPKGVQAYVSRGEVQALKGKYDKAMADFSKAIELEPKNPWRWERRGVIYVRQGKWDPAIADLSKMVQLEPTNACALAWLASARLGAGRPDEYRKDFAEMLRRFGQTDRPVHAYLVAATCTVGPDATADWPSVVALAEKAANRNPNRWGYVCVLGAVLYRAGRFEEAVQRLTQADQLAKDDYLVPAEPWFFLAMAHHRLGHGEESKKWLGNAVAWTENALREHEQGVKEFPWIPAIKVKLLRQEAEALLKSGPVNAPQNKEGQQKPKP